LSDPDNEILQTLKAKLEEIMDLSLQLKNKAKEAANQPQYTEPLCVAKTEEADKNILKVSYFNVSKCK
jgi:hypothetical protein